MRAEDARQQVAQVAVGAEKPAASQAARRQRGRLAERQERFRARRIASARRLGARQSGHTFLEPKLHIRSSAICPGSRC